MSPVDSGKYIGEGALVAITAAACVIPDAWWLAGEAYAIQGDPGAIWDSGQAWLDSAGQIGEAIDAAIKINNSIGAVWDGADYTAFVEKNADYIRQLMAAQVLAYTTGVALIVAAIETFVIMLVFAAIGVALAIWAAAILAAIASVVGNLGASEAVEADALLFVVECESIVRTMNAATTVTDGVLAGGIGAVLALDVAFQLGTGNTKVLGELAVATVEGVGTISAGMTAKVLQDKFVKVIGNPIGRTGLTTLLTGLGIGTTVTDTNPVDAATQPVDASR